MTLTVRFYIQFFSVVLSVFFIANSLAGAHVSSSKVAAKGKPMVSQKAAKSSSSMQELIKVLSAHRSFQADFEQTTKNQSGKALQKVNGLIKLQRPGQFYWKAFQPYPQLLVSNGKTIWQYDEDLEQVVVKSYQQQMKSIDLITLLETPELFAQLYTVINYQMDKKKRQQRFFLNALDTTSPIKSIGFVFEKGQLTEVTIVDAMKQQTQMRFSKRQLNKKIAAKTFIFSIPKGADVINEQSSALQ